MTVYRWAWLIKHTRFEEATKLLKEGGESFWKAGKYVYRIYSSDVGPGDTLVFEAEAEDDAHFTEIFKRLDAWSNAPFGKDWWNKFNDMVERSTSTERWNLVR